jgi:hypothetical protein
VVTKIFITIFTTIVFFISNSVLSNQLNQDDDTSYSKIYQSYGYLHSIGRMGMDIINKKNTDYPLMVLGSGNGWSVLKYNSETKNYDTIHRKPNRPSIGVDIKTLMHVKVAHVKEVNFPLIITAYYDGLIEIFNGNTFEMYDNFTVSTSHLYDFAIGDANNDGRTDITISTEVLYPSRSKIFVIDLASHKQHTILEHRTGAGLVGQFYGSVQVGQVNEDEKLEIVLSSGAVFQVNGSSQELIWSHDNHFGSWIELGNIDDDEQLEIVAVDSRDFYRGIDVVDKVIAWEKDNLHTSSVRLMDVTGDNIPEIILGDGSLGRIKAIDIKTQERIWFISNISTEGEVLQGVHNTLILDSDGDGSLEVIWGTGAPSNLMVYDLADNKMDWQSDESVGPFKATASADLDNDGQLEIVYVEGDHYYGTNLKGSRIIIADAITHKIKFVSNQNFLGAIENNGFQDVKITNLDNDEQLEIIVSSSEYGYGAIYVLDGKTFEVQSKYAIGKGNIAYALETLDVDDDGVEEIIVGTSKRSSDSLGTHVYAINAEDGSLAWASQTLDDNYMESNLDIHIADINNHGTSEILVSSSKYLSILNSTTGEVIDKIAGTFNAIDSMQLDSDEALEFITAKDNFIRIYDGDSLTSQEEITLCDEDIKAIKAIGNDKIVVACGSELVRYNFLSNSVDWSQETFDINIGLGNSITLQTINDKSQFLVSSTDGVFIFESSSNSLPVAQPDSFVTHWRDEIVGTVIASDLNESDNVNYELVSNASMGLVNTLNYNNGEFNYIPNPTTGQDKFYFRAKDNLSMSPIAEVRVTITNNPPKVINQSFSSDRSSAISGNITSEDSNDDPLIYKIITAPNKGTLTLDETTGSFEYTPNSNASGQDSFEFIASDSVDDSNTGKVSIDFSTLKAENSESKSSGGGAFSIYFLIFLFGISKKLRLK